MPVSGRKATTKLPAGSVLGQAQRRGNAAAAGAAGENAFVLHQLARADEAFLVGDLQHVVEHLEIHGRRENILADAFDDVGARLADLAGLEEFVVERPDGIDADDLYVRDFFPSGSGRRR